MRKDGVFTVVLAAVLGTTLISGCATTQARIDGGGNFATAGIVYVDALPAVFDESFRLSVEANTYQLLFDRDILTEAEREEALDNADVELTERLRLLRDLRRHSLLLRSYFLALQALMTNDSASGISSAADNVINRLDELRPGIAEARIGDADLSGVAETAANLVVGAYTNSALARELEKRGDLIERELALQQRLIDALVEDMMDNAQLIVQIKELNPVFEEYVTANRVSDSWSAKRVTAYKRTVELESYDDIRKAASTMHASWVALVEKRSTAESFDVLLQDVEQLLAVARLFKAKK
jgi:hypothetical protein